MEESKTKQSKEGESKNKSKAQSSKSKMGGDSKSKGEKPGRKDGKSRNEKTKENTEERKKEKSADFSEQLSASHNFVEISPPRYIEFPLKYKNKATAAFIFIKNLQEKQLVFKIKTSFPDAFKVRPKMGLIWNQGTAKIKIVLLKGYYTMIERDRFLVTVMQLRDLFDPTTESLTKLWNRVPMDPTKSVEVRLYCKLTSHENVDEGNSGVIDRESGVGKINEQLYKNYRLESHVSAIIKFQLVVGGMILLCALIVVCLYYFTSPIVVEE